MADIMTLKQANTVASEAKALALKLEEAKIAKLIETAALGDDHSIEYPGQISKELITKLETKGYSVRKANSVYNDRGYIIGGF